MRLTDQMVSTRSKHSELHTITRLNVWGCGLTDVSIVRDMPAIEILALSANNIRSLSPFEHCKKLRILSLRKNDVRSFDELRYLQELPDLQQLWLDENPCQVHAGANYRLSVLRMLPNLAKLDDKDVSEKERAEALQENKNYLVSVEANDQSPAQDTPITPEQVGGGDIARRSIDTDPSNEESCNDVDLRSQQQNQQLGIPISARVRGSVENEHAIYSQSTIKANCGYQKSEALREVANAFNDDPTDSCSDNEASQRINIDRRSFGLNESKQQSRRSKEQSDSSRYGLEGNEREQAGCSSNNTHLTKADETETSVGHSRRSAPLQQFDVNTQPRNCDKEFGSKSHSEIDEPEDFEAHSSGCTNKTICNRIDEKMQNSDSYEYRHGFQNRRNQEFVQKRQPQVAVESPRRYNGGYYTCGLRQPCFMCEQLDQHPRHQVEGWCHREQPQRWQQQRHEGQFENENVLYAMKLLARVLTIQELTDLDAHIHDMLESNRFSHPD